MHVLKVEGTPYEMGRQHGAHALGWRTSLLRKIHQRLQPLAQNAEVETWFREAVGLLQEAGRPFLEYAQGQADELEVPPDLFLRFCLASYVEDRQKSMSPGGLRTSALRDAAEGCTTWAASGDWLEMGGTLLVKNRDQRLDQLGLQRLVYARPAHGHVYVGLTTLGWPGLASSGLNAAGLGVADTHVRSTDLGPGLPRWWLMMVILEQFSTVGEAVAYLQTAPRLGNGNLVLADATGAMAVFEEGHAQFGLRGPEENEGYVVSTNHFVSDVLKDKCRLEGLGKKGDTLARKARMEAALAEAKGRVSPAWARAMMSSVDGLGALCWQDLERNVGTISTAVLSPNRHTIWVRHGRLCHGRFQRFVLP
ncbi:MAG: hypothetical protein FJ026_09200 [Chloroflexi bacterium]|nr:hypothetical protein [Chloroflexota bacterium]